MKNSRLMSVLFVLCLTVLIAFTLCACSSDEPSETPDPNAVPSPEVSAEVTDEPQPVPEKSSVELGETPDAGQEYVDKLVFIGDSTTYGLKYYAVLSGGKSTDQVLTPASGTLALFNQSFATVQYPGTDEEIPIVDAVIRRAPEYLVLTIGVNGVSMMDEDAFKSDYISLVERIKENCPNVKIICNSIYPVEASYEAKDNGINNQVIDRANGWIYDIAEATGTHYVNSASVLKGSDGRLIPAYGNGDGIHLCADGFNAVLNYLRTHAWT